MNLKKITRKMIATVSVIALCVSSMLGGYASAIVPITTSAVFDSYGNTFQDYEIDRNYSIFSNLNNNGMVLSDRPSPEIVAQCFDDSAFGGIHPRILVTKEDFNEIASNIKTDATLKSFYDSVIKNADSLLKQSPLIWELRDGVRLWFVSQDFIDRMLTLGIAYQITGDEIYAQRGFEEMDAIAHFDTWHPEHHIDVGGLAVGYAIGYDWLYHFYSPEQREMLERAANRLCFSLYADGLQNRNSGMKGGICAENNHNAVMNSGGIMMAAAFYETNPEFCSYLISSLIRATEYTIDNLIPDGSWYEGISYGTMMIEYYSMELATLQTIFDTMFGLDKVEGTSDAVEYIMNFQCPTGSFSYGDGGQGKVYDPGMLYLLDHFGHGSENFQTSVFGTTTDLSKLALSVLWYKGESSSKNPRENQVYYDGNEVITARNSWDSLTPTFVGMKGASPSDTHGHMDIGTFCFYSDGVQWTYDPGAEGYNVPDYWVTNDKNGGRWQYYRMRAEAHNCVVIDPSTDGGYEPKSRSHFIRYETNDSSMLAVLDMLPAHGTEKAESALRGYYFADNRQSFVVRDEIVPTKDGKIAWFMSTKQSAEIVDGKVILTSTNGAKLEMEFLSNSNYDLFLTEGVPLEGYSPTPEGNSQNKGLTRIVAMIDTAAHNPVTFTAKLTPSSAQKPESISKFDAPLENWTLSQTAPVVKISPKANCKLLPENSSFDVEAASYGGSPADKIKMYEIADGSLKELTSKDYNSFEVSMSEVGKNYVAILYDQNGNEKSRSDIFSTKVNSPKSKTVLWNENFDNATTIISGSGKVVQFADSNGNLLKNHLGDTLSAYQGTRKSNGPSSIVELSPTPMGGDGKSIHLYSRKSDDANDQAQLNNFLMTASDGVLVVEMDYLFKNFDTSKTVGGIYAKSTAGTGFWPSMPSLGRDGTFAFGGKKLKFELNRWYNIKHVYDIEAKTTMLLVDDKYLSSVTHTETTLNTIRYSFQLTCDADSEAYADNFKVTHLAY